MKFVKNAFKISFPKTEYFMTYSELKDGSYVVAYHKDGNIKIEQIGRLEYVSALIYNTLR